MSISTTEKSCRTNSGWGGMIMARMYAPDEGRWKGVDALGDSFPSWSPYNYVMNSPLVVTDPDGRDTLIIHIEFNPQKSTDITAIFNVTFSLISNGSETVIELDKAMSMISDREDDKRGTDNSLSSKEFYTLSFDQMSQHRGEEGWENTLRVTSSGVFVHPGEDYFWFGGCKGVIWKHRVRMNPERKKMRVLVRFKK